MHPFFELGYINIPEIDSSADYAAVKLAIESGICVFASAHLKRVRDVPQKLFERYVVLDGLGRVGAIYGADERAMA